MYLRVRVVHRSSGVCHVVFAPSRPCRQSSGSQQESRLAGACARTCARASTPQSRARTCTRPRALSADIQDQMARSARPMRESDFDSKLRLRINGSYSSAFAVSAAEQGQRTGNRARRDVPAMRSSPLPPLAPSCYGGVSLQRSFD
eukprot:4285811-Pleurochrysis_carterae.AAC.1